MSLRHLEWAVAAGAAGWAAVRLAGADRADRIESWSVPLLSFTPQVAVAAPLAALGLGLAGRRRPAATVAAGEVVTRVAGSAPAEA